MSKETSNKEIVGRWFAAFWGNPWDPAIIDELAAPNILLQYSLHAPRRGREDVKAFMQGFREAFPDVLDSMARALRAGYALPAAVDLVASDAPEPIATELKKASAEANLGMGWDRALENLARRVPVLEVNIFISAVVLHARTGGKLGEVLAGVAENMREAISLQGEVRALAAHGKLTGVILTGLPVAIAIMMTIFSPGYMETLYYHPWGKTLIAGAIGCLVLAQVVIRKIVDIKI